MKNKDVAEKPTKMKPRGKNIGETLAPVTEPGDNKKYLLVSMELASLPKVDLHDPDAVQARLNDYFSIQAENDLKPTVAGMGLALGLDRRRLWEIRSGAPRGGSSQYDLPAETVDSIKRAYVIMENLWENYMQNGKINPVSGIFLGKNNYGYQDKTEYVVTPNCPLGDTKDTKELEERYIDSVVADFEDKDDL